MTNSLETKQIESVKELLECLQAVKIAEENLASLKEAKDDFLKVRETEATKKVEEVFEISKNLFIEIDKNVNSLIAFKEQISTYADNVYKLANETRKNVAEFNLTLDKQNKFFDQRSEKLKALTSDFVSRESNIEAEKDLLKIKQQILKDEEAAIKDKREAFERAWVELEAKEK